MEMQLTTDNPNVGLNLANRIVVKLALVALSRQMLDTGFWIFRNALTMKSGNIEYPETSIQDQPALAGVFVAKRWLGYRILCNNRDN